VPEVRTWELRAAFARSLSDMYGREVPAYTTLLDVAHEVNAEVLAADPAAAQRLGSIDRVTAERHGAIRLGTPKEMAQVARVFGALGMYPVGFYDLRDAGAHPLPVVSTAFRPIDAEELARNPFRVFTSLLTPGDRRYFSADLQTRIEAFLSRREIFSPGLLTLADRAESDGGLSRPAADEFLRLATATFELSGEPVERAWYDELEAVSTIAADIAGVSSTHINHLTPRVLDIDDLYARMSARGIAMIDAIQGPPAWEGPDVLLRQTSFRALAEPRRFQMADGEVTEGTLRVRFGEVEARGVALTRAGRAIYDAALTDAATRSVGLDAVGRADVLREIWRRDFPDTEAGLDERGLAYFTYGPGGERRPIVYEDFLPASAAGIFASNLTAEGRRDPAAEAATLDADWIAGALGRDLHDPFDLYAAQSKASRARQEGSPR
jgi:uncharacterized glyoxalase superfamily metalloenzyme YdcJ